MDLPRSSPPAPGWLPCDLKAPPTALRPETLLRPLHLSGPRDWGAASGSAVVSDWSSPEVAEECPERWWKGPVAFPREPAACCILNAPVAWQAGNRRSSVPFPPGKALPKGQPPDRFQPAAPFFMMACCRGWPRQVDGAPTEA